MGLYLWGVGLVSFGVNFGFNLKCIYIMYHLIFMWTTTCISSDLLFWALEHAQYMSTRTVAQEEKTYPIVKHHKWAPSKIINIWAFRVFAANGLLGFVTILLALFLGSSLAFDLQCYVYEFSCLFGLAFLAVVLFCITEFPVRDLWRKWSTTVQ